LEQLYLEENFIQEIQEIAKLAHLINLKRISFQSSLGAMENPICKADNYRYDIEPFIRDIKSAELQY
jgi:hypothetical protein